MGCLTHVDGLVHRRMEACWVTLDPLLQKLRWTPMQEGRGSTISLDSVESIEEGDGCTFSVCIPGGGRLYMATKAGLEDEYECWVKGLGLLTGASSAARSSLAGSQGSAAGARTSSQVEQHPPVSRFHLLPEEASSMLTLALCICMCAGPP